MPEQECPKNGSDPNHCVGKKCSVYSEDMGACLISCKRVKVIEKPRKANKTKSIMKRTTFKKK